jgi:hypothetical protein
MSEEFDFTATEELEEQEFSMEEGIDEGDERKTRKPRSAPKRGIITINEGMRILVGEEFLTFQRKLEGKDDAEENWYNDGYFGNYPALLKYVRKVCANEKVFKKGFASLSELVEIFAETDREIEKWFDGKF